MTIAFYTFGCKLNQCETEALASCFREEGFSITGADEPADLYIVNTCTVTSKSEQKARRIIRKFAVSHPISLVIVTGCYAQLAAAEILTLAPNLVVVPQDSKNDLFSIAGLLMQVSDFSSLPPAQKKSWVESHTSGLSVTPGDPFAFRVESFQFHTRAFCKIQDGCDYHCTYCRVPLARGGGVSLDPAEVTRRVEALEKAGYREVVLTGVNICAYHSAGIRLPGLLERLLAATSRIRVRLSSLEPEMINDDLAGCLQNRRICPHFHLPVQSGSDKILGLMKRRYRAGRVIRAAALLTRTRPGAFLAADVIVGFPGETAEDFEQTRVLLAQIGFAGLHIFPFSPRPGTPACGYKPPVAESERKERAASLKELGQEMFQRYLSGMQGRSVEVLLEKELRESGRRFWQGVSENYLKVRVPAPETVFRTGTLLPARIIAPGEISLAEVRS